jgi:hypothetical protein
MLQCGRTDIEKEWENTNGQKIICWTKIGRHKKGGPRTLGLDGIHKVMKESNMEERRNDQHLYEYMWETYENGKAQPRKIIEMNNGRMQVKPR